jgi:hypothetical protein
MCFCSPEVGIHREEIIKTVQDPMQALCMLGGSWDRQKDIGGRSEAIPPASAWVGALCQ